MYFLNLKELKNLVYHVVRIKTEIEKSLFKQQ